MGNRKEKLRLALPDGHLQDETRELFSQAGFELKGYHKKSRNYRPTMVNEEEIAVKILRPQEIPLLVCQGAHDLGVTGRDWLEETGVTRPGKNVKKLLNLEYGRVRLVLAMPEHIRASRHIRGGEDFMARFWQEGPRIATEYINTAKRYVLERKYYQRKRKKGEAHVPMLILPWMSGRKADPVKIILSYGITEAKPPEDADGIIDNTATGESLRRNNLVVVDTVLKESTAWLIGNSEKLTRKRLRTHVLRIAAALDGAITARKCLHIYANLPKSQEANLRKSCLWRLARRDVTVVRSESGLRIDLLIERRDYHTALSSLRKLQARDVMTVEPQGVSRTSRPVRGREAPYEQLLDDEDLV